MAETYGEDVKISQLSVGDYVRHPKHHFKIMEVYKLDGSAYLRNIAKTKKGKLKHEGDTYIVEHPDTKVTRVSGVDGASGIP